jgi:hypothetical protein
MDRQIDFTSFLAAPYRIYSASISYSASNVIDFLRSQGVTIEDPAAVLSFLTNYHGIVAHLFDIPKKISEYFENAQLKLGLFSDPDTRDGYSELYIEVETSLSPKQANEKLHRINREWLITSSDRDLGAMNITLKFL